MFELFGALTSDYMPHGGCFLWNAEILWTHVLSDAVIGLSYLSIPITLAVLVRKRDDLVFSWVFIMFASFILFCGATHLMEIWTTWEPFYWTEGAVKVGTAVVSAWTAIAIWFLLPEAVNMPGPNELRAEIKEREMAQDDLARQQALTSSMINSIQDIFYVFDDNGNMIEWNDQLPEITGYSDEEIAEMDPMDFSDPNDADKISNALSKVFEEESRQQVNSALMKKNGDKIPYQFNGAPLYDENSEIIGLVGTGRDISQQIERENNLREARRELKELNKELEEKVKIRTEELEQFIYAASHDLREPARIISTYTNFLREDLKEKKIDDDVQEDIKFIENSSRRMTSLIDSLLKLSRTGNQELDIESFELEKAVNDAVKNLEFKLDETGSTIEKSDLPTVRADRALVTDLYQNLISNAIKYSGDDVLIELTSEKQNGEWVLGVKDNGEGIAKESQEKIFEPFTHLNASNDESSTGIGLSICRKIVERHGGQIWVESTPGEGSHFKFKLS